MWDIFLSSFHGKGYAYESLKAFINYFVDKYKVNVFTAGTALKNLPLFQYLLLCLSGVLPRSNDTICENLVHAQLSGISKGTSLVISLTSGPIFS